MTLPIENKVIIFCTGAAGLFLPPKADFLYLRLFSLPPGRRGWGWRGISESALSRYLPTRTDAKGEALKSHKSFCRLLGWLIQGIWAYTLQVTPTAKRNSYRVAILVGRLPRVACFARNPGLGKRNSFRVAAAYGLLVCIFPHVVAACGPFVCIIPHVAAICGLLVCIISYVAAACGPLFVVIPT